MTKRPQAGTWEAAQHQAGEQTITNKKSTLVARTVGFKEGTASSILCLVISI